MFDSSYLWQFQTFLDIVEHFSKDNIGAVHLSKY